MTDQDQGRVTAYTAAVDVPTVLGPEPGTVLGDRYEVSGTLGVGGTGIVVKAFDRETQEEVAIKLLKDNVELDEENLSRFLREARAAFRLRSEHAAKIRDVGTFDDGRPFMIMELLQGMDLGRLLAANHKLDRHFAVDLTLQAADALAEAHGMGVIHRDIKPSNLFVTWRPDGTVLARVLDFGISKAPMGSEMLLTGRSSVLGTPAYMSPEQMRSASTVDARTDVWSLGTVLYEMVEGRPPFEATNYAEMCVLVSTGDYTPMTQAPELAPTLAKCLAKDPRERFANIADLAFALAPFSSDPDAERAKLNRVFRFVGKAVPFPTISLPAIQESPAIIVSRPPVRDHRPPPPSRDSGRTLVTIIVLVVAVAIGIGVALAAFG